MNLKVFPKDKWWYIVTPTIPFHSQVEKLEKLSGVKLEGGAVGCATYRHSTGREGNFCLNHFNVSGISSGASNDELVEEVRGLGFPIITWGDLIKLSIPYDVRKELTR